MSVGQLASGAPILILGSPGFLQVPGTDTQPITAFYDRLVNPCMFDQCILGFYVKYTSARILHFHVSDRSRGIFGH